MIQRSSRELQNLIRRCLDPQIASQLLRDLVASIWRRVSNRSLRGHRLHYPPNIRELSRAITTLNASVLNSEPATGIVCNSTDKSYGPKRLKLAVGFSEFNDIPDWLAEFDDHEQFVSLHRWNWLIWALTDEMPPASWEWSTHLVQSWLESMGPIPDGPASESYTVGERIANLCMVSRVHHGRWRDIPEEFRKPLHEMATFLALRLEYQPGDLTSNHVVNNARALLLFGHSFGDGAFIQLARALLDERLTVLVSKCGFLREGSSHYQFLFTRWIIECWLVSKECGDTATLQILEPWLIPLISACRFFLVDDGCGGFHFPTFGDISPDFDPQWLLHLPFVATRHQTSGPAMERGWVGLIRRSFADALVYLPFPDYQAPRGWQCYQEEGWFRLDHEGWVALWHAESPGGPAIGSHAHHDFGSVVLFSRGREVLIDPGRMSYKSTNVEGKYGVSAHAHNTLLIDGLAPMLSRRDRFLPKRYRTARITVDWVGQNEICELSIEHDGFSRIAGSKIIHTRKFIFTANDVTIKDNLGGFGECELEFLLQQPFDCEADEQQRSIVIEVDLDSSLFHFSKVICGRGLGWRYPAYGMRCAAITWRAHGYVSLPFNCYTRLREVDAPSETLPS